MIVRTIRTWSEFGELSGEWNDLLQRSRASSIFLTWEWIHAWRRAIQDSVEPYVIVVRRDTGELAGVAPMYVASVQLLHTLEFRMLRYLADTATGAEYPDWIADARDEPDICDAIAEHLRENFQDWDVIWLRTLSGWTGAEQRVRVSAERHGLFVRSRDYGFTYIELPRELLEFENRFSAKSRQQLRRNSRRIRGMDGIEFARCRSQEELPACLGALFELHQAHWQAEGVDGCFRRKPVEEAFYREMAPIAVQKEWLWLFVLRHKGAIKAVQYGYIFNGTYFQLQEGYDPSFQSGAGNALRHFIIDQCIRAGIEVYDFLGGVSEHKRRWGGVVRTGYDLMIGNQSWRSRLLLGTRMWPTGRFMQERGLVTVGDESARLFHVASSAPKYRHANLQKFRRLHQGT